MFRFRSQKWRFLIHKVRQLLVRDISPADQLNGWRWDHHIQLSFQSQYFKCSFWFLNTQIKTTCTRFSCWFTQPYTPKVSFFELNKRPMIKLLRIVTWHHEKYTKRDQVPTIHILLKIDVVTITHWHRRSDELKYGRQTLVSTDVYWRRNVNQTDPSP